MGGTRKKQKSDKSTIPEAMLLTVGGLDEIGDIFTSVTKDIWGHIEEQYHSVLMKVEQGLKELQEKTCITHAS